MVCLAIAVQLIVIAVYSFGDITFIGDGRFGLDIGHAICLAGLYACSLLFGLVWSIAKRKWTATSLQILIPAVITGYYAWPPPHYDSTGYQYLIGETRESVERQISSRKALRGVWGEGENTGAFVQYNGMTVVYSDDDVVIRVDGDGYR